MSDIIDRNYETDLNCPRCNKSLASNNALQCRECSFKWYQCPKCNANWIRGSKVCQACSYNLFEDKSLSQTYPIKEKSVMNYIDSGIIERIKTIKWFGNCGKLLSGTLKYEVHYVKSWKEACENYSNVKWENTGLAAQGDLTVFLTKHYPDEYRLWNKVAVQGKLFLEKELLSEFEKFKNYNKLDKLFVDCLKWDILGFIMESFYSKYKEPGFYTELIKIYESGNFPCGWRGKWPKGKLIIY